MQEKNILLTNTMNYLSICNFCIKLNDEFKIKLIIQLIKKICGF